MLVVLAVRASHRPAKPTTGPTHPPPPASTPALPDFEVQPVSTDEGLAKWYDVPEKSLAQRRAWPGELTAASDRYPKNSYVRVRRADDGGDPGKTVVVRITDDGVDSKGTLVDLDREAATELGMIKAGKARVRVEVLALKNATTDKPVEKKDDAPIAPKASELTNTPTASETQEKAAASAKPGGQSP
ncbi:MAG: hypothetical protein INR65_11505 [Gluconacetobacter diazotrophicus]|nr:hypothetical protein [Gluconacetobacter diazotrophicus]